MTNYDAMVEFDRVLHAITLITCHWLGMPTYSCRFIYHLLHKMKFNVITGHGTSQRSFSSNKDVYLDKASYRGAAQQHQYTIHVLTYP
jgi:hypothetical protein